MLFAGFNVAEGEYSLFAVDRWSARSANLVGSWIAYAVGYYGRVDLLEKHGASCTSSRRTSRGPTAGSSATATRPSSSRRMLPIIRTFISLPAGVARMPFWRFTRLHRRRLHPVGLPARLHRQAGRRQLGRAGRTRLHYVDYAVAVLIVVGRRLPRRPLAAQPRPRPRRGCRRPERRARRCATRVALGRAARARPSCCRSPPRRHIDARAVAARLALRRARPASCARRSRSRCTPARRRRCWSRCATRSATRRAASTAAARRSSLGSFVPPAVVGYTLERPIERRLGTPADDRRRAAARLGGDGCRPTARADAARRARRPAASTRWRSALAQACALMPGVSRNGATLAAARARGFDRADANALSRHVALPVIVGATALKGARLARRGAPAGAGGAPSRPASAPPFASTLASARLIRAVERDRSLRAVRRLPRARSRRLVLRRALAESARDERRLRRRRRRHRRRPTAPSTRSSASCARSSPAGPSRSVAAQRPLRRACCASRRTSGSRCRPTASARSSSSPSRPAASTRSGIDCIAMNVNDVVCVGAEPIALLDYLAVEQADPRRAGADRRGPEGRRRGGGRRDPRRRARRSCPS